MRRFTILPLLSVLTLLASTAQAQVSPPPAHTIERAAALHLSAEGFRVIGQALEGVIPTGLSATGLSGEFDCGGIGDDDDSAASTSLQYEGQDIDLHISADQIQVQPVADRLLISMAMTIWSDPAQLDVQGDCLIELDEVCTLSLQPTPLNVDISMQLSLAEGNLSAQVESFTFTHGNFGNPIETGCLLGDLLDTLLSYEVDLIGQILGSALDGQLQELESQLENALGSLTESLTIAQQVDALGATIDLQLRPASLQIDDTGMLIQFSGQAGTDSYGSCVPQQGAYELSSHDMPALTGLMPDNSSTYHLGIVLNQDLANQLLYAAWQGGALCIKLEELSDIEITTDYLSLVEGDLVAELWPEPQPLDIRITSADAPQIEFFDEPHLDAELELSVFGQELDRATRFWASQMLADAGFGVSLEQGSINFDIDFDLEQQLGISTSYNEWLHPDLAQSFGELLPSLAGQVLDLEALTPSLPLPSIYGIGLSTLQTETIGSNQDYLGIYGWMDPAAATPIQIGTVDLSGVGCGDTAGGGDIVISGCEDDSGCAGGADSGCAEGADSGCGDSCSGGCSTAHRVQPSAVLAMLLPLIAAARRRR